MRIHVRCPAPVRRGAVLVLAAFAALILLAVIGALTEFPALAQAVQPSPTFDLRQVPAPGGPPIAALGRAIYQENCARCHGETGEGDGPTAAELEKPPAVFADAAALWDKTPAELFHTAKFGRIENLMPPWGNQLDDAQIWQAVTFAWSLHTNEAQLTNGAGAYAISCANCHDEQGRGDGPDAEGELPDFTDPGYAMGLSQADWLAGWQKAHPEVGAEWSLEEQSTVLEYVRSFSYVPPWEPAFRPGAGRITGIVGQGTAGGAEPVGLPVTLEAFVEFAPVATFTTTVGATGHFTFADLAVDPGIVYIATVPNDGVQYSSPVLTLTGDAPSLETEVFVYERTDDPSGLRVNRAHWIVDSQPGALVVGQIFSFGSDSDRAFVGHSVEGVDEPVTVAIAIPDGVEEIEFENGRIGERFKQVGNVVYDTTPIVPGEGTRQIVVRYAIPYDGSAYRLVQEFLYPIDRLTLLVSDLPQLEVDVSALDFLESRNIQGRTYRLWQQDGLQPGTIELGLSGLLERGTVDPRAVLPEGHPDAAAPAAALLQPWMMWTIALASTLVLAGVFVWAWQRGVAQSSASSATLRQQRGMLIQEIARLDDRHALGELDEFSWQQQRADLKAQLLELSRRLADEHRPAERDSG